MANEELDTAATFSINEEDNTVTIILVDGFETTVPMDIAQNERTLQEWITKERVSNQRRLPPTGIPTMASLPPEKTPVDTGEGYTIPAPSQYRQRGVPLPPPEDQPSFRVEAARVVARGAVNTSSALRDFKEASYRTIVDPIRTISPFLRSLPFFEGAEYMPEEFDRTEEEREEARRTSTMRFAAATTALGNVFFPRTLVGPGDDLKLDQILDPETGRIKEVETGKGMTLEMASFMLLFLRINAVGGVLKGIKSPLIRSMTAGVIADQLYFDPMVYKNEETGEVRGGNIATMLEPYFLDDKGDPKNGFGAVLAFLSTDEDDNIAASRMKMALIDGVMIGGIFDAIGEVAFRSKGYEMFNKNTDQLDPREKADIAMEYLEEARTLQVLRKERGSKSLSEEGVSETAEGVAQVVRQNREGLRGSFTRMVQIVTQSRGYLTNLGKHLVDESLYAQRAYIIQAENTANRLQRSMNKVLSESTFDSHIVEDVQRALTDELAYPRNVQNREEVVRFLQDRYSFPRDVASEVLNARMLIDDLSKRLVNSNSIPESFRETINENIGSYLRRSYRAYEDVGYVPRQDIRIEAEDFLRTQISRNEPNLSIEQVDTKVQDQIRDLLDNDIFDFSEISKRVNIEILSGRKDIPPQIRALLGEIEEPAENIVLSISKMAKLYETSRFFDNINQVANGKYIFDEGVARDTNIFSVKIEGTNSILDGKYTTPETFAALQGNSFGAGGFFKTGVMRNFALAKGVSQQSKTVLSLTTQARNILGGAQFGLANGVSPFTGGRNSLRVLWNRARGLGDEEFNALYERYLRLGLINTNVRVNEFRSLLETGAETTVDGFFNNFSKFDNYSTGGIGGKIISGANQSYMAVDDFFKINNFNRELESLKEAFPDRQRYPIDLLEEEAAKIVKDTFPNYDRVPPGVKATRFLPVGNFVSFPAEILRTSFHIIKQGSREITSGNPVLKKRGLQRLAGFFGSMSAWGSVAQGTALLVGLDKPETEAINIIAETPWNMGTTQNIFRVGDKFYTNDTQFLNSYQTIRGPLVQFKEEIEKGELFGEDLDKVLFNAAWDTTKTLFNPFISESLFVKALDDVRYAALSGDGRNSEGKRMFEEGQSLSDITLNLMNYVVTPFLPGTIDSLAQVYDAAMKSPNPYTGESESVEAELIAMLLGMRFKEVKPADALRFAYRDYTRASNNDISSFPSFIKSPDEVIEAVKIRQDLRYRDQQELYRVYKAVDLLLGESETYREGTGPKTEGERERESEEDISLVNLMGTNAYTILLEEGMSPEDSGFLISGLFSPESSFYSTIENAMSLRTPLFEQELDDETRNKWAELSEAYWEMLAFPLDYAPTTRPTLSREEGFGARSYKKERIETEQSNYRNRMLLENEQRIKREQEEERERREELEGVVDSSRLNRKKGGEVNIPQAPVEPDERIDKMTGLPYNQQAGGAFIDEEDRAGLTRLYANIFGGR